MNVGEILQKSASWLAGKGLESPRLEAELLLAHVLGTDRVGLYVVADRPLDEAELDAYRSLLRRRAGGEPVAYLTGGREFYGLEFKVTPDVLVPRPETELIVDRVRELAPATLLDLGTGSGCIAVSCAVRLPEASVTATDLCAAALEVARGNAERHAADIRFLKGDLFDPLEPGSRFDLIASNPPYVAEGCAMPPGEPRLALHGGREGLDLIRRVIDGAPAWLAEGGTLLVEIGEEQELAVKSAARRFESVVVHRDLAGLARLLEASAPA